MRHAKGRTAARAVAAAALILAARLPAQVPAPVNPDASPEARQLLAYLYSISGKQTLAGQHNYNEQMDRYSRRAQQITGKLPAVWGTDFIWDGTRDPGPDIVAEAIKKHRDGFIVTLMWHAGRPTDDPPFGWSTSIQGKLSDAEWEQLVTPGSPLNLRWQGQVDRIASYLAQLRDAHVPVLWRPYHEMNGVWFWWGDKQGPSGFAPLYRLMYDRFVTHHRLNNLLWVWDANGPRDIPRDQAYSYAPYYPGASYVDVLATDVYHFDYEQKDYEELLALAAGKPVALGEVGELPNPDILEAQPRWTWFMVWADWLETHNSPDRVREIYSLPRVLTHDQVRRD